ncbi:molybdate ABC transporter substrate-binding protein [Homoserinibacter sp. GY 40078]|nr:molybdate ABC transporter substrate-binding protein [Homoserinibacter sp. GY 40078]
MAIGASALLSACGGATPDADQEGLGTITVLAAASLTESFDALAAEFERSHPGSHIMLSYGGSSGLAQQIVAGAPADVFASADEATMSTVDEAGLAADPTPFASNTLELVVPVGNPGDVNGIDDLARDELVVALCDPAVPCGAAAVRLLDLAGVAAAPDTLEQDVKAVLTKVTLDEADAGLVYVTDGRAAGGEVEELAIDGADEVRNRYLITAVDGGPNPRGAAAWIAFVTGEMGREVLADAGFGEP